MPNPNERRADDASRIIDCFSDRNFETDGVDGMATDIGDLMTNLLHLCDRYGINHGDVLGMAERHYEGDMEDGPAVQLRDWDRKVLA